MELKELYQLMDRFSRSGLMELQWQEKDSSVVLKARPAAAVPVAAAPPVQPEVEEEEGIAVTAPLVGTFYAAPAPDEAPFVTVGQRVEKGQTLCILEAMKMMSQVPAPETGTITEICVQDGEAVGYGTVLMRMEQVAV